MHCRRGDGRNLAGDAGAPQHGSGPTSEIAKSSVPKHGAGSVTPTITLQSA